MEREIRPYLSRSLGNVTGYEGENAILTRQLLPSLMLIVALVGTVEAGSKKAPAKAPKEPIDKMLAFIRQHDPKGAIVRELQFYPGMPLGKETDDLQIIVTNNFHRAHYQERYQLT